MLNYASGQEFTTGWLEYWEDATPTMPEAYRADGSQKIYLPVFISGAQFFALVDTAAPYVILGRELAEEFGLAGDGGEVMTMHTRHGRMQGSRQRIDIELRAEFGQSQSVQATAFICEWPDSESVILGYQGFLQRLNFGIDSLQRRFHFGPSVER